MDKQIKNYEEQSTFTTVTRSTNKTTLMTVVDIEDEDNI